ncbi:MAG: FTR1 family protein [Gemmatimonadales bacterium]
MPRSRLVSVAILARALLMLAPSLTTAQEPPAKRLSAIVGVAVEEYAKGVDAQGRITSAVELEEAAGFLREARVVAQRLTEPNADAVRLLLDSLTAAASRRDTPLQLSVTYLKFVNTLGAAGALDLPTRDVDLARGKELYGRHCAVCHGVAGAGDGPTAKSIVPPPAPIGDAAAMRGVSPALLYRIVSVGVKGTMMVGWSPQLVPDDRWAVIAYVTSLRASDADRARGAELLRARCAACASTAPPAARSFTWQVERSDSQFVWAILAGDSATGITGVARLAPEAVGQMVAALRVSPIVTPGQPAATSTSEAADPRAVARQVLRLVDDALTAARERRVEAAGDLAFDAYIAFEPLESSARMRDPGLVADMERRFADFKGSVKAGDVAAAATERDRIERGMPTILELATPTSTWWGAFVESLIIIVREGFEAIIVIGAIVAFLIKTGNRARLRDIWWGTGAGLAASAVLAVLMRTVLKAVPASQELLEGVTLLIAVVVLFSVSYWLISKVEGAKWQRFIRDKVNSALTNGGSLALGFVAFLAVFREGAETALFYQALFSRGANLVTPISLGLLVGFAALAVIFTLFYRFGVRIPLRWFFAVTSGLLYYMALVFAGKGIMELQEADVVARTVIPGFPHVDVIGLYPTVETLMAQGVLLALLVFALWRTLTPSPADEVGLEAEESVPPEVAARLAELQAAARRLQDRVDTLEKEIEHDTKKR